MDFNLSFIHGQGVYLYFFKNQCLYVGMTKNFCRRHKSHLQARDTYTDEYDTIILYQINNTFMIPAIEQYFIIKEKPLYNIRDANIIVKDSAMKEMEKILDFLSIATITYSKEFFEQLCQIRKNKANRDSFGRYIRPDTIEQGNRERIVNFDWEKWSGVELYGETAEQFKQEIGLKNKDYSLMAVSGIYKNFPTLFARKKRKKIDGKRVWAYELKKGSDLIMETFI